MKKKKKTYILAKRRFRRRLDPFSRTLAISLLHFVCKTYISMYQLVNIEKKRKKLTYWPNNSFAIVWTRFRERSPIPSRISYVRPISQCINQLALKKNEKKEKKLTYWPNDSFAIVWTRFRERSPFPCQILYVRPIYQCISQLILKKLERYKKLPMTK